MTSTPGQWGARSAVLLLMAATGCRVLDVGDFGSDLACSVASAAGGFEALGAVFGAPGRRVLADDSGQLVSGVEGKCSSDACDLRLAQVGAQVEIRVDLTLVAAHAGVSLDDVPPVFESTNAEIITINDGSVKRDPCSDHWVVSTGVKFAKVGQAALRVRRGGLGDDELARFSFEVAQATSLDLTATPGSAPDSLDIVGTPQGTRSVRGGLHVGVSLRVRARGADGRVMLVDNAVRSTIDDDSVARFALSAEPASAHGTEVFVFFLKEGSTTLRATLGEHTTLVELQADPSLPSLPPSAAGSAGSSARE